MDDILDYLYNLQRLGINLDLVPVQQALTILGNPQLKFPTIHVAGTNGKGSTCAFLASILREAGYKVGLYTSPHLVKFNERIQINGVNIPDERIIELTAYIKQNLEQHSLQLTFFEFTTVMTFLYFFQEKIDLGVIEVGLGGRLDATNVLNPLVSVITSIDLDHTNYLGDTKEKIAWEKAGIIKSGIPVVVGEKDPYLISIFQKIAAHRNSDFHSVKKEISLNLINSDPFNLELELVKPFTGQFKLGLAGWHQLENASTTLLAINELRKQLTISEQAIKEGLLNVHWPGRMQIISSRPLIMVDGAHNVAGMTKLREFVQSVPQRRILVLGMAKDKDLAEMTKLIVPLFEEIIITKGNFKPAETRVIAAEVKKYTSNYTEIPKAEEAVKAAREKIKDDEFMLVTGSLYLVGDVLGFKDRLAD